MARHLLLHIHHSHYVGETCIRKYLGRDSQPHIAPHARASCVLVSAKFSHSHDPNIFTQLVIRNYIFVHWSANAPVPLVRPKCPNAPTVTHIYSRIQARLRFINTSTHKHTPTSHAAGVITHDDRGDLSALSHMHSRICFQSRGAFAMCVRDVRNVERVSTVQCHVRQIINCAKMLHVLVFGTIQQRSHRLAAERERDERSAKRLIPGDTRTHSCVAQFAFFLLLQA